MFPSLQECLCNVNIGVTHSAYKHHISTCLLNYFQDSNSLKDLEWNFFKGWVIMLLKKNLSKSGPYEDLFVVGLFGGFRVCLFVYLVGFLFFNFWGFFV